ncbi:methylated-DNA--[protein]-cysteine S-methyltransferase [Aeromonas veronii]
MSDYARIADAIRFIASQVERQPTLDEIAAHVHLSPFHFQRLFSRWAGVTPKRYLQVLTLERAKALLQESRPLLEVADTLGLSSGSRLYDHFVQLEAVTPGEYKQRGAGLVIDHGVHDTPFGQAFVALTPRGVCKFSFLDEKTPEVPLTTLAHSWPEARLQEAPSRPQNVINTMFDGSKAPDRPISLHVSGTNFQISVWRALLQIPPAKVVSYAQVASAVGNPKAARAVGLAVGANPVALGRCEQVPDMRSCLSSGAMEQGSS